jgi:hypothetical protein
MLLPNDPTVAIVGDLLQGKLPPDQGSGSVSPNTSRPKPAYDASGMLGLPVPVGLRRSVATAATEVH